MSENSDVLCINCESMISYEKVTVHSEVCFKPTSQIIKLISSNYFYQVQYRLSKLKTAIEGIAYSDRFISSPELEKAAIILVDFSNELVLVTDPKIASIEKTTEISSKLRKFSETLPVSLLVYSERLRSLALEKTYAFLDYLNSHKESESIKSFISEKNKELSEAQAKVNSFNKRSVHLQGLLKSFEKLEDVASVVESSKTINSSLISPIIEENLLIDDLDGMLACNTEELTQKSAEDLKRYFYSKCLHIKLSFPSRHPAQYIQIPELYEKIMKTAVPLNLWEDFIQDEFSHPERWIKKISANN